jgi:hypothetical protein
MNKQHFTEEPERRKKDRRPISDFWTILKRTELDWQTVLFIGLVVAAVVSFFCDP